MRPVWLNRIIIIRIVVVQSIMIGMEVGIPRLPVKAISNEIPAILRTVMLLMPLSAAHRGLGIKLCIE